MLRHLLFYALLLSSLHAQAGNFDFLPTNTGPEKEFQSLMQGGNFRQALLIWESSQHATGFAKSKTGVATWSYLLYQNGLPFMALDTLMQSTAPDKIDTQLVKLWSTELKNSPLIQKSLILTRSSWKSVVDNEFPILRLSKKTDVTKALASTTRLGPENVNKKARIWWQIATQAPLIGDVDSSLKALKLLRESGQTVIGLDLISLTQGRVLYQKGDLAAALTAYNQIPKSSTYWVEGVEERAWTHLRQSDFDQATGAITTAISPALSQLAGPETYFLANLIAYRVCDYSRIFNTSETFKERHRTRLADLQELAQKGANRNINEIILRFEQKGVNLESAGAQVDSLPRGILRDQYFVRQVESRRLLLGELKKAATLIEESKTLGASPEMTKMVSDASTKTEGLKQLIYQRARTLAKMDLKEYKMILNKMHIIEAEVIQRLHMDDNLKGERSKLSKVDDPSGTLVFPYSKNEVWMDELDNYKARVKDCPTKKDASL